MFHASTLVFKASKKSYNKGWVVGQEVVIYQSNKLHKVSMSFLSLPYACIIPYSPNGMNWVG
jgi:hypothetical protein